MVECRNEVCEVQRVVGDIVQRAAQEETRYGDVAILFRTNRTGKVCSRIEGVRDRASSER